MKTKPPAKYAPKTKQLTPAFNQKTFNAAVVDDVNAILAANHEAQAQFIKRFTAALARVIEPTKLEASLRRAYLEAADTGSGVQPRAVELLRNARDGAEERNI